MSEKTMLDMGGVAFLDGDPLGLRQLEEELVWNPTGPLPEWLAGADLDDDDDSFVGLAVPLRSTNPPAHEPVEVSKSESKAPTIPELLLPLPPIEEPSRLLDDPIEAPTDAEQSIAAAVPKPPPAMASEPLVAELVETGPMPEPGVDGLMSINDLLRFVEEPTPPTEEPAAAVPTIAPIAETPTAPVESIPVPLPARRMLDVDEMLEARFCLLASVVDRLWAIPLDRIERVTAAVTDAVDLRELQERKRRRKPGIAVVLDHGGAIIVDEIRGPRTLAWEPPSDDDPPPLQPLARASLGADLVDLLDCDAFRPLS